ncbi:MAG: hypothetical protein JSS30_08220 [Verrucomicrobia bacterium]|nr:hypothetical protein [Verrucomicrobiota bacterium]
MERSSLDIITQSKTSNLLLKQLSRLALLAPLSMGYLGADECCEQNDCCQFYGGQGDPLNECAFPAGYGQFGGIELDTCVDILVSADFIYWSPNKRLRGDIYKFQNNATFDILIFDQEAGYKPGFKVGVGLNFPNFDNWTFEAIYTRYHNDFTRTFNTTGTQTVSPFSIPLLAFPFTTIRSTTTFNYDNLRLLIQRPIYLSPCLILDPYFCVRGFVQEIKVAQNLNFVTPQIVTAAFQDAKLRTWAIDLCAGGYGSMLIGCGFRLVFEGELGIAYYRATTNDSNVTLPGGAVIREYYLRDPWWLGMTGTGGGGISWGTYFCGQKYHLKLSALYELEAMWGPFQAENAMIFLIDLEYSGLTVSAQFDF